MGFYNEDRVVAVSPSAIYAGQKTTVDHTVAEALAASQACSQVFVKALTANTDVVYVGGALLDADGLELAAGESVIVITDDVAKVYVQSVVDNEGVGWLAS